MEKIKTSRIAAFINTGTAASPIWSRIRKQGTLKLSYNANVTTDAYIDSDTTEENVDRYAVGFDGELVAHKNDPVFEYLDNLRISRATDEDALVDVLVVYKYKNVNNSENTYVAEKNKGSVQFSEFGGEGGGGNASLNYKCSFNGDPIIGKVTVTNENIEFSETSNNE